MISQLTIINYFDKTNNVKVSLWVIVTGVLQTKPIEQ